MNKSKSFRNTGVNILLEARLVFVNKKHWLTWGQYKVSHLIRFTEIKFMFSPQKNIQNSAGYLKISVVNASQD